MATQYMDYGIISSTGGNNTSPSVPINNTRYTQVYYSTHEGEDKSLSFTKKAFISFTYDDRKIEDFGLIAVTVNDRLNRETPPEHEDYTTEYKMLHGQYYWGSHYTARELDMTLATDGMTQDQLDDFKYWFRAGSIRELVLSEHPNRAIKARVREAPKIAVVPFKRKKTITIGTATRTINVIEYKGEIELNFVMDEPFWYAKEDILGHKEIVDDELIIVDDWKDVNGNEVNILDTEDALRIVEEDHIPTASMIYSETNLANGMQLMNYNERKYTIGTYEPDAPIINDESGVGVENDKNFQLDGAVVGPLMRSVFKEDQKMTEIPAKMLYKDIILNNQGKLQAYKVVSNVQTIYTCFTTERFLPVKAESLISYESTQITGQVVICLYTKNDGIYNYQTSVTIGNLFEEQPSTYTFTNQCYARFTIYLQENTIPNNFDIQNGDLWTINNKNNPISLFLIMFNDNENDTLNKDKVKQYFYSGTAPSSPQINFSIPIHFNKEGYIDSFNNIDTNQKEYGTICLQGRFKHELKLTNPSIFNSYNRVIQILKDDTQQDMPSLIKTLRESIGHPGVRNWIINCINIYFNNSQEKLDIVTPAMKKIFLSYMPYLFANNREAQITIKEDDDEPDTIRPDDLTLPEPTFSRVYRDDNNNVIDAGATRFQIRQGQNKIFTMPNASFAVQVQQQSQNLNNAAGRILYYRWQYSKDNGNKWYLLFDEDNRWSGVEQPLLRCLQVRESDIGIQLRCIISNNSHYAGKSSVLTISRVDDTLKISIPAGTQSEITTDYSTIETIPLTWKIEGSYLQNQQQYRPQIFYSNNNSTWDSYSITDENLSDFASSVTFYCPKNAQPIQSGARVKLRLYRVTAENTGSQYYVDSPPFEITLNRLFIPTSLSWQLQYKTNSQQTTWQTSTVGPNGIEYREDTYLRLILSDLSHIRQITQKQWSIGDDTIALTDATSMSTDIAPDGSSISVEWVLTDQINEIKLTVKGPGGEWGYIDFQQTIKMVTDQGLDGRYDDYNTLSQQLAFSKNSKNQQLYIDQLKSPRQISFTVTHQNQVPELLEQYIKIDTDSTYPFIYHWYHSQSQNTSIDESTELINGTDGVTIQSNATSSTITIQLNKTNYEDFIGFYQCKMEVTIYQPSTFDKPNENQRVSKTLSQQTLLKRSIDVHLRPGVINTSITFTGQDLQNTEKTTTFTRQDPKTITYYYQDSIFQIGNQLFKTITSIKLQYTIQGYINTNNIQWYKSSQEKLSAEGASIKTINEQSIQVCYTLLYTEATLADIYSSWYNQRQEPIEYYATAVDIYTKSVRIPHISISFDKSKGRRIQSLTIESASNLNRPFTWNWPYFQAEYSASNSPVPVWHTTSKEKYSVPYNFSFKDSNTVLSITGTPGTKTAAGTTTDPESGTKYTKDQIDGYSPSLLSSNSTEVAVSKQQYSQNNNQFITIGSINCKEYSDINFQYQIKIKKNFGIDICFKQGETILQSQTYKHILKEQKITNEEEQEITPEQQAQEIITEEEQEITIEQVSEQYTTYNCSFNWPMDEEVQETTTTSENINIQIRAFYNHKWVDDKTKQLKQDSKWPDTIGYYNNNSPGFTLPARQFAPANFPTIDGTQITITTYEGVPRPDNGTKLNNIMLKRNIPNVSTNNTLLVSPSQKCPVSIDCATGKYTMQINYNYIKWPNGILPNYQDVNSVCQLSSLRHGEMLHSIESVGDMILSNDLIFEQQNHFGSDNTIQPWSEDDKTLSHKLTYDGDIPLQNFKLEYTNYYL